MASKHKQFLYWERIGIDIASQYIMYRASLLDAMSDKGNISGSAHESMCDWLDERRVHPIPLNVQAPQPRLKQVDDYKTIVVPITCRYGVGLSVCVGLEGVEISENNSVGIHSMTPAASIQMVHCWRVLRLTVQRNPKFNHSETLVIEGIQLLYLFQAMGLGLDNLSRRRATPVGGYGLESKGRYQVGRSAIRFPNGRL